ncbi:MAG: heme NO-binding domain-containing protein [Pseudomonadota bacterium]
MYGLVNKALCEMLTRSHGAATWEQIRVKAGVDVEVFISMDGYPDAITYQLVGAASEVLGEEVDKLLYAFGRHWVLDTAAQHYGHLLQSGGRSFREFLLALPNFHARVSLMMPQLVPPEFACSDIGERTLHLHYRSQRPGLVPFVEGLLDGLGELFHVKVHSRRMPVLSEGPGHAVLHVEWSQPI